MKAVGEASEDRQIQTRGLYLELPALMFASQAAYTEYQEESGKRLHFLLVLCKFTSLYFIFLLTCEIMDSACIRSSRSIWLFDVSCFPCPV